MSLLEVATREFLAAAGWPDASIEELAGDASTRRYARVRNGAGRTAVLMDCGGPLPEVDAATGEDRFAFARWRRFYADIELRVPGVLASFSIPSKKAVRPSADVAEALVP